ncbi:MAG: TolC family protein [Prevotella sp.]|nr:TolC family protein [Prevotella sp.]
MVQEFWYEVAAKRFSAICLVTLLPLSMAAQTLEECQRAAERNYPLIRQYDLIGKMTDVTVDNIGKGWLPQVSASAQATYQSDVASWPDGIKSVYSTMGINMKGLKKDQYRIGVDVSQTVYDGGAIRTQKDIARQQGAIDVAQTEVTMYQVRRRVNEMYFALLLLDEQISLNADLQELLNSNEKRLSSMYRHGTAAESDYLSVKAERLNVVQQGTSLQSQRRSLAAVLSAFCGIEVKKIEKPARDVAHGGTGQRPELKLIDARLSLADAREKGLDAALRPRLSVFASGFYGYPGYNMFDDMMSHDWSLNGMVGARLSWNIGALYTRKNDKARIRLERNMAETSRSVFVFNNNLEQMQQNENIERFRRLAEGDAEIISLRSSVRRAAESKLEHGIIDVNDLIKEINAENGAKVQQTIHEIEMLKEIYDLKFTNNEL